MELRSAVTLDLLRLANRRPDALEWFRQVEPFGKVGQRRLVSRQIAVPLGRHCNLLVG
jgi:hypothetical protein